MFKKLSNLLETHPEIAKEAYGWDPAKVLAISYENIAWRCNNNHIWVEAVINRTEKNKTCPKCSD